jgi:hypothetical protein
MQYKPLFIPMEERRLPVLLVDTAARVLRIPLCYMPPDFVRLAYGLFRRQLAVAEHREEVAVPGISLDGAPLLGMEALRAGFKRLVDVAPEEEVFEFFFRNALVTYDVAVTVAANDGDTRYAVRLLSPDRVALPNQLRGDRFFVVVHRDPVASVAAHVLVEGHRRGAFECEHLATGKNFVAELFVDKVYAGLGVVECPGDLRGLAAEYPEQAGLQAHAVATAVQLTVHERGEGAHLISPRPGLGVTIKHPHPMALCKHHGYVTFARARAAVADMVRSWLEAMEEDEDPLRCDVDAASVMLHALLSHTLDVALSFRPRATPLLLDGGEGKTPSPGCFRVRVGPICCSSPGRASLVGMDASMRLCRHRRHSAWMQGAARQLAAIIDAVREVIADPRSGWGDALARHACRNGTAGEGVSHHGNSALRAQAVHAATSYLSTAARRCADMGSLCRSGRRRVDPGTCISRWLL